jgi:DNA polymerase-4
MKNKVIGHMDMDAFYAAVEQRDDPNLAGRPVVIGADPQGGQGRGVVATCSYEARKYGIRSAMPISRAYRLCPQAHFMRGNMAKYKDISRQIFQLLYQFTDIIEPVSIDEAYFDISSSYHLFRTPLETGKKIKATIRQDLSLNASIGIASTKMVTKIASDYCKPNGLLEIPYQDMQRFLWDLPVERLPGVGQKTLFTLKQHGIRKVRDLAGTDKRKIFKLLGEHGGHLHDLANGIDEREVGIKKALKSVSHEHTFSNDTSCRHKLTATLSQLSQKVSRRLRKYGLKGRTISLKIRTQDFTTYLRSKTLSHRTNYFDDIYAEVKKMYQDFDSQNKEIRLLGVKVTALEDPYVRDSLFEIPGQVQKEKLHQVVDRIKNKFGDKSIQRGHL